MCFLNDFSWFFFFVVLQTSHDVFIIVQIDLHKLWQMDVRFASSFFIVRASQINLEFREFWFDCSVNNKHIWKSYEAFRSIRCISKFANQSFRFLSWFDTILPLRKQFINLLFQLWTKKQELKKFGMSFFLYWEIFICSCNRKKKWCAIVNSSFWL